jgi:hypothetical protein
LEKLPPSQRFLSPSCAHAHLAALLGQGLEQFGSLGPCRLNPALSSLHAGLAKFPQFSQKLLTAT